MSIGKIGVEELAQFEQNIGYSFQDKELAFTALTHASCCNCETNYQRLEFLGDSILGFIVAETLYKKGAFTEGEMTRYRAQIVRESSLSELAQKLDLSSYLIMGKGEIKSGGAHRPSILADVYEAIVAAIYLDGGMKAAKAFVDRTAGDFICSVIGGGRTDFKSLLQELAQKTPNGKVTYQLEESSGDTQNGMVFVSAVYVNGKHMGNGTGSSKKRSEQKAAKVAYNKLIGKQ